MSNAYHHLPIRKRLQLCELSLTGVRDELNRAHALLESLGVRNLDLGGRRLQVRERIKLYLESRKENDGQP